MNIRRTTNKFETIRMGDLTNYPQKGNKVKVHYDVYLKSTAKKIESSRDEGEPYEFMLGRGEIIEVWEILIPKMSLGEKIRFECMPSEVFGSQLQIGSRESLIFIIELISFI